MSLEAVLERARETVRADAGRSFEAAWEWAGPRARTEEEAILLAAALAVLNAFQAVIAPRRMPPGALASLQVTGTRSAPDGPRRCHLVVAAFPGPPPEAEPDSLWFSAEEIRSAPFRCAGRILGEVLEHLAAG